jgi:DNA repair exonuclease SbcCD nuclease subunit
MARPLREVRELSERNDAPIFYAGDIFDRWTAGPEVINFAIKELPPGYAVPGQHDLPNHAYNQMHRSAYGTLVAAKAIRNVEHKKPIVIASPGGRIEVHGFPWGAELTPVTPTKDVTKIAMVHRYVCTKETSYPGAPEDSKASWAARKLKGFDVAVFGDNHQGFIIPGKPTICNCGGFMRRRTSDRDYRPGVGLLLEDGRVVRHRFDLSEEHFVEKTEEELSVERTLDVSTFVGSLKDIGDNDALSFEAALIRFIRGNGISKGAADIITKATQAG